MLGLGNRGVVGMGLVLVRDFGRGLLDRLAGRLIARILVTGGWLARDVLAGRNLGRIGRRLSCGEGGAGNGLVAASMGTLAMAVAAASAAGAAPMVVLRFGNVRRRARGRLEQLP